MGDERRSDGGGESWTDVEEARPEMVELVPVRQGVVLGGRYAIDKIIGRGGSGVVVRAHDRDLRQVVAIKIVRAELAGQRLWAARLAREVRLARQIHHPHVCRVFDFQQADGRVFLVMELAEKGTVRDELRSGTLAARPLADRIADARAVASALAAIHGAGIMHRDLTPQNMLRMADGRLVLSDFGLAMDISESTSVQGGTIAYMAPEVLRGGHSSLASDIWALGVVMYEIIFGEKPSWSAGATPEIRTPAIGRKLTKEERAALEACRACTDREPARRIATAAEAGQMLAERRRWRLPRLGLRRRPVISAGALTAVAAAVVAVGVARMQQPRSTAKAEAPLIVPTGTSADWTDVSTVLVEVPDRIHCTRLLSDQRSIRFVWGVPARAEDIDVTTRKRVPSPLVPAAYAEGCPDLSPDGKRLVYQGHATDGRAFAFLSESPDGRDAVPVVPTAEPTMSSEPTWLADGQMFTYDVDARHVGVFSTALHRVTIIPEVTSQSYVTLFRSSTPDAVLVSGVFDSGQTEVTSVALPWLKESGRFRISEFTMDLRQEGELLYGASPDGLALTGLMELDARHGRGRRLGFIRDQTVRYPGFRGDWLSFLSRRFEFRLVIRQPDGAFSDVSDTRGIFHANPCGNGLIVDRGLKDGRQVIERLDRSGRLIRRLSEGPMSGYPACSPDGRIWYFVEGTSSPSLKQCRDDGCRVLATRGTYDLSVSPDGKRLAFLTLVSRGPLVEWMPVDGGASHEVTDSETGCAMGWASNQTLWVSRRRDGKIIWTEVDVDSGKETGKAVPGQRDCTDGGSDPMSPVNPDLRVIQNRTSQLRLLPRAYLSRR